MSDLKQCPFCGLEMRVAPLHEMMRANGWLDEDDEPCYCIEHVDTVKALLEMKCHLARCQDTAFYRSVEEAEEWFNNRQEPTCWLWPEDEGYYSCSLCGGKVGIKDRYCSHCGATVVS